MPRSALSNELTYGPRPPDNAGMRSRHAAFVATQDERLAALEAATLWKINPKRRTSQGDPVATSYTLFPDLAAETTAPARGILSQTLSDEGGVELVLFAFAAAERLSEHTSARPAIIHLLQGTADLTIGGDAVDGGPGTWVRMPANLPHSVVARTPLVMALYLLPPTTETDPG